MLVNLSGFLTKYCWLVLIIIIILMMFMLIYSLLPLILYLNCRLLLLKLSQWYFFIISVIYIILLKSSHLPRFHKFSRFFFINFPSYFLLQFFGLLFFQPLSFSLPLLLQLHLLSLC